MSDVSINPILRVSGSIADSYTSLIEEKYREMEQYRKHNIKADSFDVFLASIKIHSEDPEVLQHYQFINGKGYFGDSGVNIIFPEDVEVQPGQGFVTFIPLGVSATVNKHKYSDNGLVGIENESYFLLPRSSIAKTPLMLSNSVGLIDSGYRGQLTAAVRNMSNKPYMIKKGTSLFQIANAHLKPMLAQVVDDLDKTDRGDGGFGSTGN